MFMANWNKVEAATGYRLDVSSDAAFTTFVEGFQDLDVGAVTGRAVTELAPGTEYFYRVRQYGGAATGSTVATGEAVTQPANGLNIVATFDPSITGNPNAAAIEACINRAIGILENLFNDPLTVPIRFRYSTTDADGTPLGAGVNARSRYAIYLKPWNTYVNSLRADARTSNDAVANTYLPTALPPGYTNVVVTSANGRALGFTDTPQAQCADGSVQNGCPYDGIVTLNSSNSFQWTRPPAAGSYDAQRSLEHEMDEVLGLGSFRDCSYCMNNSGLRPQDLFGFSAAGNRSYLLTGLRYFSINNGNTRIVDFNQQGGDKGDWASPACPQQHPYTQNASACTGQYSDVATTSPEGINLDVIGYNLGSGTAAGSRFDFNRDGKPDYVLYSASTHRTLLWYLNNNTFLSSAYGPTLPAGWRLVDVADFNRDGKPDYLLYNPSTHQSVIWYLNNNAFASSAYGPTLPGGWEPVVVGDFNSDGKPDYVIYNASTRQTVVWYMNNNVYVSGDNGPTLLAGWKLAGTADFNGDGKTDYLLYNASTRQSAIWYLSGVARIGTAYGPTAASGYTLVGATDFNGDGKTDFVIFSPSTGRTALWYLNNNVKTSSSYGPIISSGWVLAAP
jgi:hypothetical protein